MRRHSPIASLLLFSAICLIGFRPGCALAHKVSYVSIGASFETEERTFSIDMAMEVDPTEDAVVNAQISPEQAASTFATEVLSLYFGDTEIKVIPTIRVIVPEPEDVDPNFPERTKVVATLAGDIPEAADYFTLHLSEDNEATAIMVHFVDGDAGRRAEVLYPGEFSNPIDLRKTIKADPFTAANSAEATAGTEMPEADDGPATPDNSAGSESSDSQSTNEGELEADKNLDEAPSAGARLIAGFRQVLPQNYPFLVALLALFFFNRRPRVLIIQVLVASVALAIAFALSSAHIVDFGEKAELVPLAALLGSAVLALENLFSNKLRWWRLTVIALTGLAFGFWFSALAVDLGLAPESALQSFLYLLGVAGAIAVTIGVLYVAMAGFRERSWYRKSLAFPASLVALGLALFWILLG
jgi:hypothetical protein